MTPEQAAAYVIAQAACVTAEVAAMQRANDDHARRGLNQPFSDADFSALIDRYGIGHNAVLGLFQGANR